MSDEREIQVVVGVVTDGPAPGPGFTTVRCARCGREAHIATHELSVELVPLRADDGTRLGWCVDCRPKPNRAERRAR